MQDTGGKVSITYKIKGNPELRGLPFQQIKDKTLGRGYELSLVFCGNRLARKLNRERRGVDKPTDILSFALDKNSGEIFINPPYAEKRAPLFGRPPEKFIEYLFIHGLFHLKGMEHGSRMENEEARLREYFGV